MGTSETTETFETGTDHLLGQRVGPVVVLSFNRPERRNALSPAMYRGFAAALPRIASDPAIRVLLLTGSGGAFCAGGDVKGMAESNGAPKDASKDASKGGSSGGASLEDRVDDLRRSQRAVSLALRQMPKPVVAALPGPAAGAGLSIALAADLRVAAERAILVTAFSTIGASGDFGGSWFLTRLIGSAKAKELYWMSPRLTAAESADLGLVNQVLPDEGFDEAALDYCQRLATRSPIALRYIKENIGRAETADLATALDAEAAAMARTMSSEDHREAVAAFLEKREPDYQGR